MFCHKCGERQEAGARFCHACGSALVGATRQADESPVVLPSNAVSFRAPAVQEVTGSGWKSFTGGGGGLLLLGFFVPWVSASCDPRALGLSPSQARDLPTLSFSGFDLAIGPKIQTAFGTQQMAGTPSLWLVLAAALAIIGLVLFVADRKLAAGSALAAALISLGPLLNVWQSFEAQRTPFVKVSLEAGLWLSLLGIAGATIGGLLGLAGSVRATSPSMDASSAAATGTRSPAFPGAADG